MKELAGAGGSNGSMGNSVRMLPTFQLPQHLDAYDIRGASDDTRLAVATLVGIINRVQPRVYLIVGEEDVFWLNQLLSSVPHALSPVNGNAVLGALVSAYRTALQGLIVYDPALIDTINIATVIAGQRDGVVVSPQLAQQLQEEYQLPTLSDLRIYQWHSRVQAYRWAQQNLLSNASTQLVAGLDPNIKVGIRSCLVATRAFIYWLDSRAYLPNFSSGQPSERALMQQILRHFSPGTTHLGWFIDESSGVYLTSRSAIAVLASDYFMNLEVWSAVQSQPVPSRRQEPAIPTSENKIYVSFTISDGDNLQYCQRRMRSLWLDPARGSLPIGWTISPPLTEAAPLLADYYSRTASAQDEFIAGPSGAGYMFPSYWPDEQWPAFLLRTGEQMQAMRLSTLEVLDNTPLGSSGLPFISSVLPGGMAFSNANRQRSLTGALRSYGLQGILSGSGQWLPGWSKINGLPVYQNLGIAGSVSTALLLIKAAALTHPARPLFLNVYVLAWSMTPSDLKQLIQQLGDGYEVVLPGTLLHMLSKTLL